MADKNNNPATLSETGRRKNNEDKVLGQASSNGAAGPRVIIAVADGMGGLEAGEMASKTVHDMLYNLHQGGLSGDFPHIYGKIKDCIKTANHNIYEWSQKKAGIQMGTTVSGAIIIGNKYLVFNVGDSRTYLIRKEGKEGIKQVTTDHSVDTEAYEAGLIKKEEIGKGAYSNALTRTVGTDPHVEVDIFPHGDFEVLNKGDILFCCTDGLWGRVKDENIRREILARSDLNKSLEFLYRLAYKNGSKDNISMAAYRYGDFTGVPVKHEKSSPKEKIEKEKKEKHFGKNKNFLKKWVFGIACILIVLILFIVIMNSMKEDIIPKIKPQTIQTPKIFDPTAKKNPNASRATSQTTNETVKEQKQPETENPVSNANISSNQLTTITTPTSTSSQALNNEGSQRATTTTLTPSAQSATPKPIEILSVPLSQLDPDIRANIEAKFKKITIDAGGITGITKKGNTQAVIALDSRGKVKSIDILGIEVEPKEKMSEVKSKLEQIIRSMNFPSPTINGKPVNVKIGIYFSKVSKFSGSIIFEI